MSKWEEKQVRPVLPLYLAALAWPVASLLFPPYTVGNLAIVAVSSAVVYLVVRRLCPMRVVRTLVPYATGSEEVDAMLRDIDRNLDELHRLNDEIPDDVLSESMDIMEKAGRKIVKTIEKDPDKASKINRFARYYLPEIVKLMQTYIELEENGASDQIVDELRRNSVTTATAFENQLDALYSEEVMEASTDIEVLDSILKSQNLTK